MRIPLVDLAPQHREIEAEVRGEMEGLIDEAAFVLGPAVSAFEESYARYCGTRYCVGVASGTDALELALRAIGVEAGDEVIVPTNSFVASALAVVRAGARPVLVDVEERHQLIDVEAAAARIGPRTRAVMAVDLYGQMPPMEALEELAESAGITLVEDAAQSHGARRHDRRAGGFGEIAGTSFYPAKNLGAWGDGGAVLTDREDLAQRVKCLRNYGSQEKYVHPELGFNSRLDTLQAIVLSAKLRRLDAWNAQRQQAAARYDALLAELPGVRLPARAEGNEHVWHLYTLRLAERDRVAGELQREGIGVGIHYPVPIHLQGAFAHLGHRPGDFPVAESAARHTLSLPLFPGIREEQQRRVAQALRRALDREGSRELDS